MQALVGVHYQLHSNEVDYLKTLQTSQTILDLNYDEVYNKITSVLQLILLILSSRKLADLLHLWLFLQSNPFFSPEQIVIALGGNLTRLIFSLLFVEKW